MKVTSSSNKIVYRALGIPQKKYEAICNRFIEIVKKYPEMQFTAIAEKLSNEFELNDNEGFFLGVIIGSYAQTEYIVNGMIASLPQLEESADNEIPVEKRIVKTQGVA